jgi:hypothetical protein
LIGCLFGLNKLAILFFLDFLKFLLPLFDVEDVFVLISIDKMRDTGNIVPKWF